jgi:hypothetical protein
MQEKERGRGDPIRPLDLRKIAPIEEAAASDRLGLGWVGLQAARYCESPAFEFNAPAITHHRLVLFTRPPPDLEIVPISRTVGQERIVDEFVYRCTHSIPMEWLLPGVRPTGRRLEIAVVVIISFEGGKMKGEQIYWDQASVLVQLGLLDPTGLPVAGVEVARKALDPAAVPSNLLMKRTITDELL